MTAGKMAPGCAPRAGDLAFAVDLAAVGGIGIAICAAAAAPVFMTALVVVMVAIRFIIWTLAVRTARDSLAGEGAVFAVCLVLGAGNDWNSVVRHRVYDYDVPDFVFAAPAVPLWMLFYWGMILRFVTTLCRWCRLHPPARAADAVHVGARVSSPGLKVAIELLLVLVTRQSLYRHYLDPLWSWLPFAVAVAIYAVLFRPSRHERGLAVLAAVAGPAVEVAFINVGKLHHYHLGWLGGVPLWLVLWWVLAVLIWNDLAVRLLGAMAARRASGDRVADDRGGADVPGRRSNRCRASRSRHLSSNRPGLVGAAS